MNKFYQEDGVWCMRKNQVSVGDKHEEFKKNFKILTKHEWRIDDCKPINYYKYDSGGNKCICTKDITTCLAIEHVPTQTKIQVGCVCYKKKTEDKHKEIIKKLKREWDLSQLPICVVCSKHKKVEKNEACLKCQPKNGCLIIDYQEDSMARKNT